MQKQKTGCAPRTPKLTAAERRRRDAERHRQKYWADPEKARAALREKRRRNRERCRAQQRARYWSNVEKERARARDRARSERGREGNRMAVAKYRERNPHVIVAHKQAQKALLRGELRVSLTCEAKGCHETSLQLHHPDYRRPTEAIRVCHRCHEHIHHCGALKLKPGGRWKWARAPWRHEAKAS
jgi:hypothetical protein